jgi:hypothetical protein
MATEKQLILRVLGVTAEARAEMRKLQQALDQTGDSAGTLGGALKDAYDKGAAASREMAKSATDSGFSIGKSVSGALDETRELRHGFTDIAEAAGSSTKAAGEFGRVMASIASGNTAGALVGLMTSFVATLVEGKGDALALADALDAVGVKLTDIDQKGAVLAEQSGARLKLLAEQRRYDEIVARDDSKIRMEAEYDAAQQFKEGTKQYFATMADLEAQYVKEVEDGEDKKKQLDEDYNKFKAESANKQIQQERDIAKAQAQVRHQALTQMYGDYADLDDIYLTPVERATQVSKAEWGERVENFKRGVQTFKDEMRDTLGIATVLGRDLVQTYDVAGTEMREYYHDQKLGLEESATLLKALFTGIAPVNDEVAQGFAHIAQALEPVTMAFQGLEYHVGRAFTKVNEWVDRKPEAKLYTEWEKLQMELENTSKSTQEVRDHMLQFGEASAAALAHTIAQGANFGQAMKQILKSEEEWALTKSLEALGLVGFDIATGNFAGATAAGESAALFAAVAGGTALLGAAFGGGGAANSNASASTAGGGNAGALPAASGSGQSVVNNYNITVGGAYVTQRDLGDALGRALQASYVQGGVVKVPITTTTSKRMGG